MLLLKLKKLDIDKLVNVPNVLSNLKTKLDDLDIQKWNVSVDLLQISDLVSREVVKNTKGMKRDKKYWGCLEQNIRY